MTGPGGLRDCLGELAAQANDPIVALFGILTVSFTLLSSVLNFRSLKRCFASDYPAILAYFGCFFLLLFAAPLAYLLSAGRAAGLAPSALGFQLGNWRLGLLACLLVVPLLLITLVNSARDPAMRAFYPFSKDAMKSRGRFALYEAAYVLLYFLAWDFAFRGLLQFSLVRLLPEGLMGAIIAILVQTCLSTVFHLGHPNAEIGGAFAVGIIFGAVAALTGSFLYGFVMHALIGVGNDLFLRISDRSAHPRRSAEGES